MIAERDIIGLHRFAESRKARHIGTAGYVFDLILLLFAETKSARKMKKKNKNVRRQHWRRHGAHEANEPFTNPLNWTKMCARISQRYPFGHLATRIPTESAMNEPKANCSARTDICSQNTYRFSKKKRMLWVIQSVFVGGECGCFGCGSVQNDSDQQHMHIHLIYALCKHFASQTRELPTSAVTISLGWRLHARKLALVRGLLVQWRTPFWKIVALPLDGGNHHWSQLFQYSTTIWIVHRSNVVPLSFRVQMSSFFKITSTRICTIDAPPLHVVRLLWCVFSEVQILNLVPGSILSPTTLSFVYWVRKTCHSCL